MQLERLRGWRARPEFGSAKPLSQELGLIGKTLARDGKRMGGVVDGWEACAPKALQECVRISGYARGVLSVVIDSAPARFELDRAMRGGLETQLRTVIGPGFVRLRATIGSMQAG